MGMMEFGGASAMGRDVAATRTDQARTSYQATAAPLTDRIFEAVIL